MFQAQAAPSRTRGAFDLLGLIYHSIVRDVRKAHRNAVIGLALNMMQMIVFVLVFYIMFVLLGLRDAALRGDFLLYIMSGIFLFLTHTKAMGAVLGAEGPASPMMQHAPMNTMIAITSSALASLYLQLLALFVVLFVYHITITPVVIDNTAGALGMILLAWFSGAAVGLVFLAIKPWAPDFIGIASSLYMRANMIASGKMFVANTLPSTMLAFFDWNPLFHTIDQARGFTFLHYNPHFSSISYALKVSIVLMILGLMGEFYTRKNVSASWGAGR